ncbi:MAG: hypothetical protein U5J97_10225 [Trueperaceae bacterium]|nr:hypothetical protein [Trueperaceae bacterium]
MTSGAVFGEDLADLNHVQTSDHVRGHRRCPAARHQSVRPGLSVAQSVQQATWNEGDDLLQRGDLAGDQQRQVDHQRDQVELGAGRLVQPRLPVRLPLDVPSMPYEVTPAGADVDVELQAANHPDHHSGEVLVVQHGQRHGPRGRIDRPGVDHHASAVAGPQHAPFERDGGPRADREAGCVDGGVPKVRADRKARVDHPDFGEERDPVADRDRVGRREEGSADSERIGHRPTTSQTGIPTTTDIESSSKSHRSTMWWCAFTCSVEVPNRIERTFGPPSARP